MTKKTEQAMKVAASWTPDEKTAKAMMIKAHGAKTPMAVSGGRLSIRAAVATDFADPKSTAAASARIEELKKELEGTGTIHGFTVTAGAVPLGTAEKTILPPVEEDPAYVAEAAE